MTEQHEFNPNEWQDSGAKWADGFRKIILDQGIPVDEDLMLGWFCNAIEIAHTHRLQTDTRPSASREEIAMAIGFASRHKFDVSKDAAEFWEHLSSDGRRWYLRMADAVLGIQPTPTPGNTDPMLIAKYDDELRKVQGGWVDAVVYEARFLVDRLKEYEADGCQCDESVRQWNGHVSAPLARLEMALSDATTPTEYPTEQPSVRDAARVLLRQWNEHGEGILGEIAPYSPGGEIDYFQMEPDLDGDWVKLSDVEAALRSLAQEGE